MKKFIITIIIAIGFISNLNAQIEYENKSSDGFFYTNKSDYRSEHQNELMPLLPNSYNSLYDYDATDPNQEVPLGSGLLLLTGLAMVYAKKKK